MKQPLVSVLMPCYNAAEYVEVAMRSILDQTYSNLEIIAINDCSTDNTGDILDKLSKEDKRIKVITNEENLRLIRTLNKGINMCNGAYIARMDSDDIALPTRIEKEVTFLEQNSDHDIVGTQFATFISENPNKLSHHNNPSRNEELRGYMLFKSGICHPSVMIRKRIFTELNLEFELEYLHVEDYALWAKALYKTKIANLEECLLHYRVHSQQVSSLNEQLQIENKKKVFKIHCEQLNIPTDDETLDIYASVAECVPNQKSLEYLDKCEQFILSLIAVNQSTQFCDDRYLNRLLSLHWLRLCANSQLGLKAIKRVKESSLYNNEFYGFMDLLIFYSKCVFKIKYQRSIIYRIIFR